MQAARNIIIPGCMAEAPDGCAGGGHVDSAGEQLDQALQALVNDPVHGLASLSVLVMREGDVGYRRQFGMRHVAGAKIADASTMYRVASVSKMVTTLGVMKLVEQGKLSLDQDVGSYLGFRLRNPAFLRQPISLRMLLTHTSSLRDAGGYSWGADVALREVMRDDGRMWARTAMPGRHFAYSNLNWGVIGTVMEAVTGERFDLLMERLVLRPLDARGGFNVAALTPAEWDNVATLYRKRADENSPWDPAGPWLAQVDDSALAANPVAGLGSYVPGRNGTLFSPTGGLRISAAGLGNIMRMLINRGRHEGRAFLAPASIAAMFSRQWIDGADGAGGDTENGRYAAWGLGVQHFEHAPGARSSLIEGGGFPASGHLGDAYGLLSVFAVDAASGSGMIVLIGGTVSDPAATPGRYSALPRQLELVLTALYRHAVLQPR